ncbi:MAG: hypothetical protein Q9210_004212 [Variospora velana]
MPEYSEAARKLLNESIAKLQSDWHHKHAKLTEQGISLRQEAHGTTKTHGELLDGIEDAQLRTRRVSIEEIKKRSLAWRLEATTGSALGQPSDEWFKHDKDKPRIDHWAYQTELIGKVWASLFANMDEVRNTWEERLLQAMVAEARAEYGSDGGVCALHAAMIDDFWGSTNDT